MSNDDDGNETFRCWLHDEEDESAAKAIRAETWREAAQDYADRCYRDEPFDECEVRVRLPNGHLMAIGFDAEMELNLYPGLGRRLTEQSDVDRP